MGVGASRAPQPLELSAGFNPAAAQERLSAWCAPLHLQCSPPFLVRWYNEKREAIAKGSQRLHAPDDAVAFAICSTPGYLRTVLNHFIRLRPSGHFVNETTDELLRQVEDWVPPELDVWTANTDMPPYYHVQTIGDIAGVDQHVEPDQLGDEEWRDELSESLELKRDPKMWGSSREELRKIFGVNVHPTYGGWYSYRMLIVFKKGLAPDLALPERQNFLSDLEARRIVWEYNLRHELCFWRDLTSEGHPPEHRYEPAEYFFFMETSPDKRRRFLEISAAAGELR